MVYCRCVEVTVSTQRAEYGTAMAVAGPERTRTIEFALQTVNALFRERGVNSLDEAGRPRSAHCEIGQAILLSTIQAHTFYELGTNSASSYLSRLVVCVGGGGQPDREWNGRTPTNRRTLEQSTARTYFTILKILLCSGQLMSIRRTMEPASCGNSRSKASVIT